MESEKTHRKWKTLRINRNNIKVFMGSAMLIQMPRNSSYAGYTFWHPSKLVHNFRECEIVYTDEFIFRLQKKGKGRFNQNIIVDKKEVGASEIEEAFAHVDDDIEPIEPLIYVPPELEQLTNVKPLEELIDE